MELSWNLCSKYQIPHFDPALPFSSSETPTAASHNSSIGSGGVRAASFFRMISNLLPGSNHSPDGLINTKKRTLQQQDFHKQLNNRIIVIIPTTHRQPSSRNLHIRCHKSLQITIPQIPFFLLLQRSKDSKNSTNRLFPVWSRRSNTQRANCTASAVPYLAMRSSSLGGYNSSGPNTPTQGTFTDTHSNNNNNSNAAAVETSTGGGGGVGGAPIPSDGSSIHFNKLPHA
ncbi:hypothetical protein BDR26DRAFT_925482 [Obelidium mucronatum]|nr:hypothetical protein BDR26DRAFT_925482 [Obelidium mucronatum]